VVGGVWGDDSGSGWAAGDKTTLDMWEGGGGGKGASTEAWDEVAGADAWKVREEGGVGEEDGSSDIEFA